MTSTAVLQCLRIASDLETSFAVLMDEVDGCYADVEEKKSKRSLRTNLTGPARHVICNSSPRMIDAFVSGLIHARFRATGVIL